MLSQLRHITVNLPDLNPRLENPERHFTKQSIPPPNPIRIQRRMRQRYFAHETRIPGYFEITEEYDFPFIWEISYYILPWNESFEDCEKEERESYYEHGGEVDAEVEMLYFFDEGAPSFI
jgi:hypothetical protein